LAQAAGNAASLLPEQLEGVELVVRHSDLILFACAPEELRPRLRRLQPGPSNRVVIATRGLDPETGKRLSEVVLEQTACLRVGALGGPLIPSEVRRGNPCAAVVASPFREVGEATVKALHSHGCRIYPSLDLADVELAGALVEVLATAIGVARGLGLGAGTQAVIVARGIAEGARLARKSGGDPSTFSGLAGVGELVACAGLPEHPANIRGMALARGETDERMAALCEALLARHSDLPITGGIRQLARGKVKAVDLLAGLMDRDVRAETT
jgi:glycerol-3-phosphate dehydrogenase (NAD(P)+)